MKDIIEAELKLGVTSQKQMEDTFKEIKQKVESNFTSAEKQKNEDLKVVEVDRPAEQILKLIVQSSFSIEDYIFFGSMSTSNFA